MTEDEIIQRAKRVARLLNEPDVQEAFADIKNDILQHIGLTHWDEAPMREVLHAELRALNRLAIKLQSWTDVLHQ